MTLLLRRAVLVGISIICCVSTCLCFTLNTKLIFVPVRMSDSNSDQNLSGELDLSSLSSLSLEPSWASGNKTEKISVGRISRDDRRGSAPRRERPSGGNVSRDRRPPRPRDSGAFRSEGDSARPVERRERRDNDRRREDRPHRDRGHARRPQRAVPPPRVVEVSFFPEDKPFNVLSKAIKTSARTYALFEIANLILEKPERFSVSVKPIVRKGDASAEGDVKESTPTLVVSVPDGMPFLNETDALAYVFEHHLEKFFSAETVEIEAPKGNFTMVSKCGFTGELLAPPNYHAYQQILRDHHAANFPKMPFEKFMSRLETVKDQESIDAWIAKMKTVVRYTIKDRKDGEPETLDGVGAAKSFLLASRKNKAIRTVGTARFPGKLIEQMPMGPMKAGIEHELAFQQRFPLNTANFLRGRLRRAGFSMFKRGSKGITLVCAIRRKFRTPDSVFSDTIQRVFDFLEKHPNTKIQDLPKLMLGIGDDTASAPVAVSSDAAAPEVPASETPAASTAETEAQLSDLFATVRWLVLEGYVSELSDGRLFTYPKMTAAQAKAASKEDDAEVAPAGEEPPVAEPEDPVPATESEPPSSNEAPAGTPETSAEEA